MALVNQRRKCIYLMEPHTASRAVASALMAQGGWGQLGHHHIGIPELTNPRRIQLIQRVEEYDIICTIRNPLDVLVTQWKYTRQPVSFAEWVMDMVNRESKSATEPMMGLWQDCNKFVYYEHLTDDLEHVFGTPVDIELDPAHITKGKQPWQDYYSGPVGEELLDVLMPLYTHFMAEFGYELFESEDGKPPKCFLDNEIRDQRCQKL